MDTCNWAVMAKCTANDCGVIREFERMIARFSVPFQAEDFIEKCLPAETRDRFYVTNIDSLQGSGAAS